MAIANKKAYYSNLEHLSDELRHLDMLIRLQIIRQQKMGNRIVNFLLCSKDLDAGIKSVARLVYPKVEWDHVMVSEDVKGRMRSFIRLLLSKIGSEIQNALFYLCGPYGPGKDTCGRSILVHLHEPCSSCRKEVISKDGKTLSEGGF